MVIVTCSAAAPVPKAATMGLVNNAQTYCGLETVIMQTRPRPSWIQRVAPAVVAAGRSRVVVLKGMSASVRGEAVLACKVPAIRPAQGRVGDRRDGPAADRAVADMHA